MSKNNKGYMGDQIGKLGPAVGRRWKGRQVYASYQKFVANPRTEAQQIIRARFKRAVELSKAYRFGYIIGLLEYANKMKFTEANAFIKQNWSQISATTPDAVEVNYSGIKIAIGDLPEATYGAVDFGTTNHLTIEVAVEGNVSPTALSEDKVYLFAYCPDLNQGCLGSPVLRSAAKVSVKVPSSWDGMEVHLYAFCIGGNRLSKYFGVCSRSAYCGTGEVR